MKLRHLLSLTLLLAALSTLAATTLPTTAPSAATPKTVDDLRAIQRQVEDVVKNALPATVAVLTSSGQGSGVIVSKDGYVLTAGHVSETPGQLIFLILADGKRVHAKTLGVNAGIDSGLVKITDPADYPFVPMGASADLKPGQWVIALGHPGGYKKDRPPVVRLGRVLIPRDKFIATDCTLIGGDSGGPLFNLEGKVVGIHSRIGASTNANIHIPIDTYTQTWDRLANGESWGTLFARNAAGTMLGLTGADDDKGCRVENIVPNTPAAKAGLKIGDIITRFDGQPVEGIQPLVDFLARRKPGEEVKIDLLRDEKPLQLTAKLAIKK